jgi:hypothetical protein
MEKKFDPTKPVQTRDGRKARIVATGLNCIQGSIVAVVTHQDGGEYAGHFFDDGRYILGEEGDLDLVNVPEKRGFWVNFYPGQGGWVFLHPSRKEADIDAGASRVACKYIEFEEGEGV